MVTTIAFDAVGVTAGIANHYIHVFSTHTGSLARTLIGHELGVGPSTCLLGGALDPQPSHNPSGLAASGGGILETVDGPILLLHNRAPAGAQVLGPQGLDHLLPSSMCTVLALDTQYPPIIQVPLRPKQTRRYDDRTGDHGHCPRHPVWHDRICLGKDNV